MDARNKMLRMLYKGKVPTMEKLRLGQEEFVKLVADAQDEGLIEGVYISFCDSQDVSDLLSSAGLTEKGVAECNKR